jgi:primosomal protein N' (replication factor Y)
VNLAQQKSLFADEPEPAPWVRDDEADRLFAEIVFNRPVEEVFLYEVPYPLRGRISAGKRVAAPFGRGNEPIIGYCVRLVDRTTRGGLKKLTHVLDDEALVTERMLELARWIAEHYCCALGQALDAMLPASVKSGVGTRDVLMVQLAAAARNQLDSLRLPKKQQRVVELLACSPEPMTPAELARAAGCTPAPIDALRRQNILETILRPVLPQVRAAGSEPAERFEPNADQRAVLDRIASRVAAGGFHAMLLHGVTGSGKTEVYLRAIKKLVEAGKEAIVLVPEISLTPQTIRRFRSRFPHVAVLHSHLPDAERHAQWRQIAAGQTQVVVGARSAIFAPTRRLGLIIIDEEHEATFKQETTPRYHARDVAWRRAELEGVPLLLGSATPSLESWHRAQTGRCELLELPDRVLNRELPQVQLIDLRHETLARNRRGALSQPLEQAMRRALESGGQVILLLNRRGFSTHIHCFQCGHVEKCRRCDIALVYHRDRSRAICHFCDLELPPPEKCAGCGDVSLNFRGLGTEKLEQEVRARFAEFACQRMDTDSMRGRGSHERVLGAFRRGELKILLGTQMIAKGLDFPGVTLVGVVNADTALHLPDFRAAERTFQLVAQVAGRTGRGEHPGRVLVQTFSPGHPAIQAAGRHDFHAFAAAELPLRREHGYPPFASMARIIVRSKQDAAARTYIGELARRLGELIDERRDGIRLLGPAPAPVSRVKNFYRYHLQVQAPEGFPLHQLLRPAIADTPPPRQVEIAIDVDPLAML